MMKTATRIMMTAAAAGMVFAPIAAQANTRASDASSVYAVSAAQPGLGRPEEGESRKRGISVILALLASGLIVGGLIIALNSKDNGQSPGT